MTLSADRLSPLEKELSDEIARLCAENDALRSSNTVLAEVHEKHLSDERGIRFAAGSHDNLEIPVASVVASMREKIDYLAAELAEEKELAGAVNSDVGQLESEVKKLKLDLKCLEESTVDKGAYEQRCAELAGQTKAASYWWANHQKQSSTLSKVRAELEKAQEEAASWRRTLETMTAERDEAREERDRVCVGARWRTKERDAANARAEAAEQWIRDVRGVALEMKSAGAAVSPEAIKRWASDIAADVVPSAWVSVNDRLPSINGGMLWVSDGNNVVRMHSLPYQQPETHRYWPWWMEAQKEPAPPKATPPAPPSASSPAPAEDAS